MLAAIQGSVHASRLIWTVWVPHHRNKNPVWISRVHRNSRHLLTILQPLVAPSFAAIGGLVDTISNAQVGSVQSLAATNINRIRVRLCNSQATNRARRLIVKNRIPRMAVVGRLPHAAIVHADVPNVGLADHTVNPNCSPSAKRTNVPPLQAVIAVRFDLLAKCKDGSEKQDDDRGKPHTHNHIRLGDFGGCERLAHKKK